MIKVNGTEQDGAGKTVSELLLSENYLPERVAVEINEQILPKAEYSHTYLHDGDKIEIVSFVGGG